MSAILPSSTCLITRIRNEEKIIGDFLKYYQQLDIFVYDDYSTDRTLEIVKAHKSVKGIIEGKEWDTDRTRAEYTTRQAVFELTKGYEWVIYVDADERIEFPDIDYEAYDGVSMKLFDFYITNDDKYENYKNRKRMGCEYREILMMFRNLPGLKYEHRDQREMRLPDTARIAHAGYVKHYGKAISIEEWESTCDYYINYFPEPYKSKWRERKGKAVHTQSDFGSPLITWEMKEDFGYPL
jgi:glycosyltransferase involved in cell wall biosynthesis